jgi:hypothetical protein
VSTASKLSTIHLFARRSMHHEVSIRLRGPIAEAFAAAVAGYPGVSPNLAGEVAAALFVAVEETQPAWIASSIRRVLATRSERRRARGRK